MTDFTEEQAVQKLTDLGFEVVKVSEAPPDGYAVVQIEDGWAAGELRHTESGYHFMNLSGYRPLGSPSNTREFAMGWLWGYVRDLED